MSRNRYEFRENNLSPGTWGAYRPLSAGVPDAHAWREIQEDGKTVHWFAEALSGIHGDGPNPVAALRMALGLRRQSARSRNRNGILTPPAQESWRSTPRPSARESGALGDLWLVTDPKSHASTVIDVLWKTDLIGLIRWVLGGPGLLEIERERPALFLAEAPARAEAELRLQHRPPAPPELGPVQALDALAELFNEPNWDSNTLTEAAEILRRAGRGIPDNDAGEVMAVDLGDENRRPAPADDDDEDDHLDGPNR